jgi:hypothetical protein
VRYRYNRYISLPILAFLGGRLFKYFVFNDLESI